MTHYQGRQKKGFTVGKRTPNPIQAVKPDISLSTELQIFDLKQLADMEACYKTQCKRALAAYKDWQGQHAAETDMIALLYGNLQGTLLKRRAQDAVEAYWVIRMDFRKWFQRYLEKNCCYPSAVKAKTDAGTLKKVA